MDEANEHHRFHDCLEPGERVLWTGRPAQGIALRGVDALLVPASAIWLAATSGWLWDIVATGAPISFNVAGWVFAIVGMYIAFGRFVIDARLRSQSYYAITDRRILIAGGFAGKDIASFSRPTKEKVSLRETTGDRATIRFGDTWPFIRWHATYWREPEFFRTTNAEAALALLRNNSA